MAGESESRIPSGPAISWPSVLVVFLLLAAASLRRINQGSGGGHHGPDPAHLLFSRFERLDGIHRIHPGIYRQHRLPAHARSEVGLAERSRPPK